MSAHHLDANRVRQAADFAQEYDVLMGLSMVPLGAGFVLAGTTDFDGSLLFGALGAFIVIGWYNRKYGAVRPKSGRILAMALGTVVAIALILAADVLDGHLEPPVSLSLLAITFSAGLGGWLLTRRVGQTAVHWVACAILVVMAFGPAVGIGSVGLFAPYTLIPVGIAFIVLGLVDHARFVRFIGPAPKGSS